MNNLKNNIRRAPRQLARRKPARVCKPSSLRLSSKLFRLFPYRLALRAFGEDLSVNSSGESSRSPFPVPHSPFFTRKPFVEGLGHAFLMRNYRAGLAKWQAADPMGYPDGWNQLAYCGNGVTGAVDLLGGVEVSADQVSNHNDEIDKLVGQYTRDGWTVTQDTDCSSSVKYEVPVEYDSDSSTRRTIDGHIYEIYRHFVGVDIYGAHSVWAAMSKSQLLEYLLTVADVSLFIAGLVLTGASAGVALGVGGGLLLSYAVLKDYVFTEARICIGEYYVYEDSKRTITYKKRLVE